MFLLSRRIKALGVKMVLSGEGSDEIFGGYLYFHNAPNAEEFHKETVRRVKRLHLADCLRANKSTAAFGVEIRYVLWASCRSRVRYHSLVTAKRSVPFLDKDFLDVAMEINPEDKVCSKDKIEKYILRKAFDVPYRPYLPPSVLWRQKEQFSDGGSLVVLIVRVRQRFLLSRYC
jgi:asparagine synthase (glutamine-hydrolysing)